MLGSLKRELGDLDRIGAWLTVRGMVNTAPDFKGTTDVINGFSDLILELYGTEADTHRGGHNEAPARDAGHHRRRV